MNLRGYFKTIYCEGQLEEQVETYFKEPRDYEEDIQQYFQSIKHRPPKSITVHLSILRTFLLENDVELPKIFWRRLSRRVKGNKAITQDRVPTKEELRRILNHLPLRAQAFYLALASSGMRIGEALQLVENDIDLSKTPVLIKIRGEYTKTGNSRITFISSEAKEFLEEWLKEKPGYAIQYKVKDVNRVFPFNQYGITGLLHGALKKAGVAEKDPVTERYKIHPHVLRKFFRSELAKSVPVDVVEAMMGHEGYLTSVYRMYSDPEKDLGEQYQMGEGNLLIYAGNANSKNDADYLSKIGSLTIELDRQIEENEALKNKMMTFMKLKNELDTMYSEIVSTIK